MQFICRLMPLINRIMFKLRRIINLCPTPVRYHIWFYPLPTVIFSGWGDGAKATILLSRQTFEILLRIRCQQQRFYLNFSLLPTLTRLLPNHLQFSKSPNDPNKIQSPNATWLKAHGWEPNMGCRQRVPTTGADNRQKTGANNGTTI